MLVCAVHTDFRLCWPARLRALRAFIRERDAGLRVVEIAGKGSPYAFAKSSLASMPEWQCLFPINGMEELSASRASAAVWRALETHRPDVVLAGAIAYPSGATAVRWAAAQGRGVVIMDNARRCDVPRSALTNWVKRRLYANVGALLLPAPSHIPDYEYWGMDRERVFWGVNTVDNEFFAKGAELARKHSSEVRERRGLPGRFLLGVGRQIAQKNWTGLLGAWTAFKKARPQSTLKLVLVGHGPERSELTRLAQGFAKGEVLLPDFAAQDELADYYGLAAGLVLPSFGETWGLVVNEAMASGLPVLVSQQCGCAQTLVEPGFNGWVFDARNLDSIVQALLTFDAAGPELTRFGERSRIIIKDWGLERFCDGAWKAIRHAATRPRREPGFVDRSLLRLWKGRYRPT